VRGKWQVCEIIPDVPSEITLDARSGEHFLHFLARAVAESFSWNERYSQVIHLHSELK
jgi:hypothetical protein